MNAYGWCFACGVAYERWVELNGSTLMLPTCECAGDPPVDRSGDDWLVYLGTAHILHYTPEAS